MPVDLQGFALLAVVADIVQPGSIDFVGVPGFSTASWSLVRVGVVVTPDNRNGARLRLTAPGGWQTEDLLLGPSSYLPVLELGLRPLPMGWSGRLEVEPVTWGLSPSGVATGLGVWVQIRRTVPAPSTPRDDFGNSLGFY